MLNIILVISAYLSCHFFIWYPSPIATHNKTSTGTPYTYDAFLLHSKIETNKFTISASDILPSPSNVFLILDSHHRNALLMRRLFSVQLPLLHAWSRLALFSIDWMNHDLIHVLWRIGSISFTPVVTDGISED